MSADSGQLRVIAAQNDQLLTELGRVRGAVATLAEAIDRLVDAAAANGSEANAASVAGKARLPRSRAEDGSIPASASRLVMEPRMELMTGSMITSNTSAWAAGEVASGVMPNAKNAPAVVPAPSTRRRLAFALRDR